MTTPKAPPPIPGHTPGSYKPPLSRTDRATLIAWEAKYVPNWGVWWHSQTKESTTSYIEAGSARGAIELDYVVAAQYLNTAGKNNPLPPEKSGLGAVPGGSTISSILDFLKLLLQPSFWLRVGEFLLGAILIGVGASKLSSSVGDTIVNLAPGKTATKVARSLVK